MRVLMRHYYAHRGAIKLTGAISNGAGACFLTWAVAPWSAPSVEIVVNDRRARAERTPIAYDVHSGVLGLV